MLGQGSTSCKAKQLPPDAIRPGTRALVDTLPLINGKMMNWLVLSKVSVILLSHPST